MLWDSRLPFRSTLLIHIKTAVGGHLDKLLLQIPEGDRKRRSRLSC